MVVLLLVIFLPMLLKEEAVAPVPDEDLVIPRQPAFGEEFDPEPGASPAETFALSPTSEPEPPDSPETADEPIPDSDPPVWLEPPEVVPPFAPAARATADREKAAPGSKTPPAAKAPPPVQDQPPPVKTAGSGWVLQVSSLTEKSRALSLVRELTAKGFPAFIERAEVGGKRYHRVRLGPRSERSEIQALAEDLREKTGYQGQVLRYP